MLVIALVVWLIVVFFSVKDELEASWIDKLIALTAPVRITPTDHYYHSYYYLVDSISSHSDYALKTIGEKLEAAEIDPYDLSYDEEPPSFWAKPDLESDGSLKDPVKKAFQILSGMPRLQASDFEMTAGSLHLRLLRREPFSQHAAPRQSFLEQNAYLGTFDPNARSLGNALLALTPEDVSNWLGMLHVSSENIREDQPEVVLSLPPELFLQRLKEFFTYLEIKGFKTPAEGWKLPLELFPANTEFKGYAVFMRDRLFKIVLPPKERTAHTVEAKLKAERDSIMPIVIKFSEGKAMIKSEREPWQPLQRDIPIIATQGLSLEATLDESSLEQVKRSQDLRFLVHFIFQGVSFRGKVPLTNLEIEKVDFKPQASPFWIAKGQDRLSLPNDPYSGEGILLPRSFRTGGVLTGDQGFLSYYAATASSLQEQRIPIFVAGFYDPGVMPIGAKYILASRETVAQIRSSYNNQDEGLLTNGINVRFDDLKQAPQVKAEILKAFQEQKIAPYWNVETYQEYDFTKDLIQQLHSEKNLFTLISTVIIIVACSNIISMLIILVNDKKHEIGILRSMGATSGTIAAIFGICGIVMGTVGSFAGILAALLTLHYLDSLVGFISGFQGHDLFNPVFYGETLPNQISYEALLFVIIATALISLLAGIVPAVKASLIRPSAILRSE
jgi:lipoprotein-releasing system permease protein